MRLRVAILLLSSWLAVSTTAMPPRQAGKLVDGSMESLKEMARTRKFSPAILDTLPFETLKLRGKHKSINRGKSRDPICADCMANVLKLVRRSVARMA